MMQGQNAMMEGFGWLGGGGMFLGQLLMIGFWALVIYLFVLLVRWIGGGVDPHRPAERTALDILQERYARCEINESEFTERKKTLLQ